MLGGEIVKKEMIFISVYRNLRLGNFDLHIHSTFSDGKYPPSKLVKLAKNIGLHTIAITDHDSLGGIEEATHQGKIQGVEVIAGVEISTVWQGQSVDVLGYGIQHIEWLDQKLLAYRKARKERAKLILKKLEKLGMPLTMAEVEQQAKNGLIGRPHIAQAMVVKGYAFSVSEVFNHYLGDGMPADVPKKELPLAQGIKWIKQAGGLAVIAHPVYLGKSLTEIIKEPWDGIEVWHRNHSKSDVKRFQQLAKQYNLVMTGGSDFHDENHRMGRFH